VVAYAKKYFDRFVKEQDIKDSVSKKNPIPKNFIQKPRLLDEHFKELLEDRKKKDLDNDRSYEQIQSRLLKIMGSLSNYGLY